MRYLILLLSMLFSVQAFAGAGAIFSGNDIKTLKANLSLYDVAKFLTGSADPTAVAQNAPPSSLYLRTGGSGAVYVKLDSGSSTNWVNVLTASSGWSLTGNAGTSPLINYLGTSDAQDLVFKTNATERLRITSGGSLDTTLGLGILKADASGILSSILGTSNQLLGVNNAGTDTEFKSILGTTNRVGVTHAANSITLNVDTTLFPSPLAGDANKALVASGADASSWQLIANANVAAAGVANIARDKLAVGSADHVVINDSSGVMTSEAQLSASRGGVGVFAATYYVDKNRSDTYTADGAIGRPYKTIQAAINAAASAAVNTSTNPILIDIVGPGTYVENLTLNSTALKGIVIDGHSGVIVNPGAGDALNSTSNNNNLAFLHIRGVRFYGQVQLVGATNNGNTFFDDAMMDNCLFNGNVVFKNLQTLSIGESQFNGNGTIENIPSIAIAGGAGIAPTMAWTVTWNAGNNIPNGASQTVLNIDRTIGAADFTVSNGALLQFREGSRIGYPGGSVSISAGGQVINYGGQIRSDISGSGTYTDRGGWWLGSNSATTIGQEKVGSQVKYTAGTSGNWATLPTDVTSALDTIAARGVVKTQSANTVFSGPSSGGAAVPTFRSLVAADIPTIDLTNKVTGILPVANGGTGANTLTANNVILGNGTSAVQVVAPGSSGNVLTSNGTTWTSATPASTAPTIFGSRQTARAIVAGTGITSGASHMSTTSNDQVVFVAGSGGAVTVSASPPIEAHTVVGAKMKVCGTSDTNTVLLNNGNNLVLNGVALLGKDDCLNLMWAGTDGTNAAYVETGRNF
jgi:hypothetical protein